jgi:hypothetical protein
MCELLQRIEATGFTRPHDELYTRPKEGEGASYLVIRLENLVYQFYAPNVQYLVDDLEDGVELIRDYRPAGPMTPFEPDFLMLWIEKTASDDLMEVPLWPLESPKLADLLSKRDEYVTLVEGDQIDPVFDLFSRQLAQRTFREGDSTYSVIARPVLPHETPRQLGYFQGYYEHPSNDDVPMLDCEGEPAFTPPVEPTVEPGLAAKVSELSGLGRVAYTVGPYYGGEIYVTDIGGVSGLRLTNNLFDETEVAWSPDGKRIAFASTHANSSDIFVMNVNGTGVEQLTDHHSDYAPSWSPDGGKIAFVSDRDGGWQSSEIYVMNADGSDETRLTENLTRDLWPVWSPDGRKIAFNRSNALAILHLEEDTVIEERLPILISASQRPAWSPDGKQIAVVASTPTETDPPIRIFNLDGTETHSFSVAPLEGPKSLDWSQDGRYILFVAREPLAPASAAGFDESDDGRRGDWEIYALDMVAGEVVQITFSKGDEVNVALWP